MSQAPAPVLSLIAEVAPPVVGGVTLQATHADFQGSYAYVAYAVAGPNVVGGIDVFDLSDNSTPVLVATLKFPTTRVNALAVSAGKLYYVGGTTDASVGPAIIGEITLVAGLPTSTSRRITVPSYTGTGLSVSAKNIYVTSGSGGVAQGGMTILNKSDLSLVSTDAFLDARAAAVTSTLTLAFQGGPGRLRLYNPASNVLQASVAVGGASVADSKATVSVSGDWAFVGAGDGGTRVVSLSRRRVVDSLPRPSAAGVAPGDAVTNAVAVSSGYVYMANGGAGVAVASTSSVPLASGAPGLAILGRITFPTAVSANYVAIDPSSGTLFVAAGRGGLKVVSTPGGQNQQ